METILSRFNFARSLRPGMRLQGYPVLGCAACMIEERQSVQFFNGLWILRKRALSVYFLTRLIFRSFARSFQTER